MSNRYVLSFFDYTGHAVREWAAQGFDCMCFDIQHPAEGRVEYVGTGRILYVRADLTPQSEDWAAIERQTGHLDVALVFGFPPCTDLASSGAKHWAAKRAADPDFQTKAVNMARAVADFADAIGAPYVIENPDGALSTLWRKPDYRFDPCDFGGYLPEDDEHPRWPKYIAPRDAYTKATNLWTSEGFVMPERKRVEPEVLERKAKSGRTIRGSRQFMLLGGASLRTKNIRNETPRGFSRAVHLANA